MKLLVVSLLISAADKFGLPLCNVIISCRHYHILGRSYSITSQRMLMQCVDSLVLKVQSGVVVNFEKIGPDPPIIAGEGMWKTCQCLLFFSPSPHE